MGITEVDFEVSDFGALINGINAGRFDVIAAGMFINPERAQQVAFADPDYCATTGFAVPEGNPDGLADFQSVIDSGVTIDRKSVVVGKSVSVRLDLGGRRIPKTKKE